MTSERERIEQLLATLPPRSLRSTLFNLARAYADSAATILKELESTHNADFAGPAVVCQSFAVELLLKFFLFVDHPSAKTIEDLRSAGIKLNCHKYSELYGQISTPTQEKIASVYSGIAQKQTTSADFLQALIAQGDDPFIRWRYAYEAKGIIHFDWVLFNLVTHALGKAAEVERRASPDA